MRQAGTLALGTALLLGAAPLSAQITSSTRIADGMGGLSGPVHWREGLGAALTPLGDVDGDGVPDVAVGAPGRDGTDYAEGGVRVWLLHADGSVKSETVVAEGQGGFPFTLGAGLRLGVSLAGVGDVDGDGQVDLAIGLPGLKGPAGAPQHGAVVLAHLASDGSAPTGSVLTAATLAPGTADGDRLGSALAALGDLDADGTPDLAVGAPFADGGGQNRGRVVVAHLGAGGALLSTSDVDAAAGLAFAPADEDRFGAALGAAGDLDGDGRVELACGLERRDAGGVDRGAVLVLFLDDAGAVASERALDQAELPPLLDHDRFGAAVAGLGDLDGDGVPDLAVSARDADGTGAARGAVHLLHLRPDASVRAWSTLDDATVGLPAGLGDRGGFGASLASPGDLDGDGTPDLLVGVVRNPDAVEADAQAAVPVVLDASYTPAAAPPTAYQRFNLFVPAGTRPAGGWPVVITTKANGFQPGLADPVLSPLTGTVYGLLTNGVAVMSAGLSGASTTDGFPGSGTWDPPGLTTPGQDHFDDPTYPMQVKDATWVIQHTREEASTLGLDPGRVGLFARSGGAIQFLWPTLGPDRADPASPDPMLRRSSRPDAVAIRSAVTYFPALDQLQPSFSFQFPLAADVDQIANGLATTFPTYPTLGSALQYGFADAAVRQLNATAKLHLFYGELSESTDFTVGPGTPALPTLSDTLTNGHSGWFGYALREAMLGLDAEFGGAAQATRSELVVLDDGPLGTVEDLVVPDTSHATQEEVEWLLDALDVSSSRGEVWSLLLDGAPPAGVVAYGCGANPAGSLTQVGGAPVLGQTLVLGLDDPTGSQSPGAIPLLAVGLAPAPGYPCGLPLPGSGLGAPAGELLVDAGQVPVAQLGPPWTGPGAPASIAIALPTQPGLAGTTVYLQGALFGAAVPLGLTEAVELVLGL